MQAEDDIGIRIGLLLPKETPPIQTSLVLNLWYFVNDVQYFKSDIIKYDINL